MTVTGPRVRDYTDATRSLTVDVVASPACELVASLFVLGSEDDPTLEGPAADRRHEWLHETRSATPTDLLDELRGAECCGYLWLAFMGPALEARSTEAFFERMAHADPVALRRDILMFGWSCDDAVEVNRVAAGDHEALERINRSSPLDAFMYEVMAMEPTKSRDVLVSMLRRFDDAAFHGGRDVVEILERNAADKLAMATTMEPAALVEAATGGVTFSLQPEVRGVVLIPSIALSPWVTITEHAGLRLFTYPVADEHIDGDSDTPPSRLVEIYKALGDERRLKIMRVLSEGPATLRDITDRLDLAKSTVHHHLRILRTAGLVRITIGDDKEYSLRTDAVPEAAAMLSGFLGDLDH